MEEIQKLAEDVAIAAAENDMEQLKKLYEKALEMNRAGDFGPTGMEWFLSSLTSEQYAKLRKQGT